MEIMLADAHCHIDMLGRDDIKDAINKGIFIMVTNSTDLESNIKNLALSDNINVFPALGVDPEAIISLSTSALQDLISNIDSLIENNNKKFVAFGEVGLDYILAKSEAEREIQKKTFEHFINLAVEYDKPLSIHSRGAINEVIKMLDKYSVKRAHFHYFEGDESHAKILNELGYYISVPPIESSKRNRAMRVLAMENIMAESDAPAVGKTPIDIKNSLALIAKAKEISFDDAAKITFKNTKKFFSIL
ncbi:MAG: TatD family hydrolase [Candidatus Micrarchaeia archaeon]